MSIITTYNSTREGYLTFLNTYPENGTSLNLNATNTGGATSGNYTGQYWRPTDSSSNTPTYSSSSSAAEFGFVVKFGDNVASSSAPEQYRGKVPVTISLFFSERYHWLYVTNKVSSPSSTSTIAGYNYQFSINGTSYNINAPITEIVDNDLQKPDFSQSVNGVTKYYTFKSGNASSTREYIGTHATRLWSTTIYVTPSSGKATVNIQLTHIYMHWTNIYNGKRPTIWTGNASNVFVSNQTYIAQDYSLVPNNITIDLKPKTATLTTIKDSATITNRTFDNSNTTNTVIVDSTNANITAYKDLTSNHTITISNIWPSGTVIRNAAWSSSNNNAIRLSSTTSLTSTNAIFNGTISNCNVTCNVANVVRRSNIAFTTNNSKTFSSSNTNLATVNSSTGKITLNAGTNGTFNLKTTFSGGYVQNATFNSLLVPNNITIGVYAFGTNTPISSINRGEKASIRASVNPFNASNSMLSVHNGYRPLTFTKSGSGTISSAVAYNVEPFYETTYTAPNTFGSAETITFTATQPNTNVSNTATLTLNANEAIPLPNLIITVKSIEPSIVASKNYCLVTYDIVPDAGERALTTEEQTYIDNISLSFGAEGMYGEPLGPDEYTYVTNARTASGSESTGFNITNPKRQCVYYVEGECATGYEQPSLPWRYLANFYIPDPYFPSNPQTFAFVGVGSVYLNYISIEPINVVMFIDDIKDLQISFSRNSTTANLDITYPNPMFVQTVNSTITYSQDRLSGSGMIRIKGLNIGHTSLIISSEGMSKTCNIYVVDRNTTSKIIYPYVYNRSGNLYYNSIRNSNKELLRVMFKLPASEIYNIMDDIQIHINYVEDNISQTCIYSLKEYPNAFSAVYPTTSNLSSDISYISSIIAAYETTYNDTPYCIFQEPNNVLRNTHSQISSFTIKFTMNSAYSSSAPNGLFSIINVDNIYNIENINVGDNLIGYDASSTEPYSLRGYIEAYKSFTQGYINNLPTIVNDYGVDICSLNHFGVKGDIISVEPFYKFLLAQNYVRAIDRFLMSRYFNIASTIKSVSSYDIPNSFYPQEIRNMYVTEEQIDRYELRDTQNKILTLPYDISTVIYNVPTHFPVNAYTDYPIMADDSSITYYNDPNRTNTFLTDINHTGYTISPLKEFRNSFYEFHLGETNRYI